jgi:hypothetical protein
MQYSKRGIPGMLAKLKKKKCWEQCIKSGGEYFEGDKAQ